MSNPFTPSSHITTTFSQLNSKAPLNVSCINKTAGPNWAVKFRTTNMSEFQNVSRCKKWWQEKSSDVTWYKLKGRIKYCFYNVQFVNTLKTLKYCDHSSFCISQYSCVHCTHNITNGRFNWFYVWQLWTFHKARSLNKTFHIPTNNYNKHYISSLTFRLSTIPSVGARRGVVVKALSYHPAGRGFDSRCCDWNFTVT